jgi:hypothetical protein
MSVNLETAVGNYRGVWAVTEQKTGLRGDAEDLAPMLPEFPVRSDIAIQGGTGNP